MLVCVHMVWFKRFNIFCFTCNKIIKTKCQQIKPKMYSQTYFYNSHSNRMLKNVRNFNDKNEISSTSKIFHKYFNSFKEFLNNFQHFFFFIKSLKKNFFFNFIFGISLSECWWSIFKFCSHTYFYFGKLNDLLTFR